MFDYLKAAMIEELGLDTETVDRIVAWQDTEGLLDYDIMKEIYPRD